jgi:hypothetical protein
VNRVRDEIERVISFCKDEGAEPWEATAILRDVIDALDEIEAAQQWTSEPPTEPGRYVWHDTHTEEFGVVPVERMDPEEPGLSVLWADDGTDVAAHPTFQWLRIPEPPTRCAE